MRIVLDALGLPRFGGARSSAVGWIAALAEHSPQHEYCVFVSRLEPELESFANLEQRVAPVQNRFALRLWAQATLPVFLRQYHVDVFHATKNLTVFNAPCPMVVTVNDLTHLLLSRYYPFLDNVFWRVVQPLLLRRAARVIAISEYTRQGLINCYGLDARRVKTVYPCYHARYRQLSDAETRSAVRQRHSLPDSYILYVGGLGVHKNVSTLVQAFRGIADRTIHGLVLVGGSYHTSSDNSLLNELSGGDNSQRVRLLDRVPEEDMPAIYQMADLFVLPSLNEGFGLTLAEAMVSGTPVVASREGAIPEVVGNAGWLLTDITNANALAETMLFVLQSPEQRRVLSERGRVRAAAFSWAETARQTLALYESVLARGVSGKR